jgi:hypothetical protein
VENLTKEIEREILKAYGSLDNPSFRFEEDTTRQKVYEPFMRDLVAALAPYLLDVIGFYKICNFTDVNTDHGYVFRLGSTGELWLQLSFVGSFAVLMRVTPNSAEVIDPSGDRIPIETLINAVTGKVGTGLNLSDRVWRFGLGAFDLGLRLSS